MPEKRDRPRVRLAAPSQGQAEAGRLWPLYGAGFVTAFGAHGVAASLGSAAGGNGSDHGLALWTLGVVLALYDGAEIVLKPVFGALSDRVGPRRVLLGGLVVFAVASAVAAAVGTGDAAALAVTRLGQGAAASAFSPAASAMVAALNPGRAGRAFGSYGAYKGLGYALGPVLGGVIVWLGGLMALFVVLGVVAAAVAVWAAVRVPVVAPVPKKRQTLVDLGRRLAEPMFWRPTLALAATTAAVSAGVGFLPVHGRQAGLSAVVTGAAVSVLAVCTALVQPWAGRRHDQGKLSTSAGLGTGLGLAAGGLASAAIPGVAGLLIAAPLIGVGAGLATPLGFAVLAGHALQGRLGQTMGAAEVGREAGDAGGPLLVGGIATVSSAAFGMIALGVVTAGAAALTVRGRRTGPDPSTPSSG